MSPRGSQINSASVESETSTVEGVSVSVDGSRLWRGCAPAANQSQTSRTTLLHLCTARDIRSEERTLLPQDSRELAHCQADSPELCSVSDFRNRAHPTVVVFRHCLLYTSPSPRDGL